MGCQKHRHLKRGAICCYLDAEVSRSTSRSILSGEYLLAALLPRLLQLLVRLDCELREARAD